MAVEARTKYTDSGAHISADGRYRYLLWREWRGTHEATHWSWLGGRDGAGALLGEPKSCLFIMFNPSTADGTRDDPTIRRCVAFARSWNFERLEVVNLFAFRTSDPANLLELSHRDDPVGPENRQWVERGLEDAGLIVCAWGVHGSHLGQDETMLGWLGRRSCYALGRSKHGHPRHPLYVKASTPLQLFDV